MQAEYTHDTTKKGLTSALFGDEFCRARVSPTDCLPAWPIRSLMAHAKIHHDAAWASGCADSTLGTCQPTRTYITCRHLCSQTLGCVGFTFVRAGAAARRWDRACLSKEIARGRALPSIHRALVLDGGNATSAGRCCLEASLPLVPRLLSHPCCTAGELEPSALCRTKCRLPWPKPTLLDVEPPPVIDAQVRHHHGPSSSARDYPWVEIGQRLETRMRRHALRPTTAPSPERRIKRAPEQAAPERALPSPSGAPSATASTTPTRVAICIAGGARTFVNPAVGWAFERFVLGAAGEHAHVDVFVVLGTGEEDHRARVNLLPLDDQEYVRVRKCTPLGSRRRFAAAWASHHVCCFARGHALLLPGHRARKVF